MFFLHVTSRSKQFRAHIFIRARIFIRLDELSLSLRQLSGNVSIRAICSYTFQLFNVVITIVFFSLPARTHYRDRRTQHGTGARELQEDTTRGWSALPWRSGWSTPRCHGPPCASKQLQVILNL